MQKRSLKSMTLMFGLGLLIPCGLTLKASPTTPVPQGQNEPWNSYSGFLSFEACLKAARNGNVKAQVELGEAYQKGTGIPVDFNQSILWFKKAAQRGNANALCQLAFAFGSGNGVDINKSMVFLYSELAVKCGDEFIAKGLNAITLNEIPSRHVISSRDFAAAWNPGAPLPSDNYFPTEQQQQVRNHKPTPALVTTNNISSLIIEYHIVRHIQMESLSTGSFSNEGVNGWDLIALIPQQPPPMLPGPSMPSMLVDAIFKRRRDIAIANGYIKWEYRIISTLSFYTDDPKFDAKNGWEIATVFRSESGVPPMIISQFVVILKRRIPN